MELDLATCSAHESYINHVMQCRSCHPPTKRYCLDGNSLNDEYLAHYLMSLDLYTRRGFLASLESTDIARCEAIKAHLISIHEQSKPDQA